MLKVAAFVSLGVILISTFAFILSTLPELQDPEDAEEDDKTGGENAASTTVTWVNSRQIILNSYHIEMTRSTVYGPLLQRNGNGHWRQRNSWRISFARKELDRLFRRDNGSSGDRLHHSILFLHRVRRQVPLLPSQKEILLSGKHHNTAVSNILAWCVWCGRGGNAQSLYRCQESYVKGKQEGNALYRPMA